MVCVKSGAVPVGAANATTIVATEEGNRLANDPNAPKDTASSYPAVCHSQYPKAIVNIFSYYGFLLKIQKSKRRRNYDSRRHPERI
mgnify:CR=1 FL=1